MTWRDTFAIILGFCVGLTIGLKADRLAYRNAKIEGIKCIGELVQCEMKLEKK